MTPKDILTPNTPSLGFGAMRLPDIDESIQLVDTYMDSGYNYFDTAYAYGGMEEKLKKSLVKRHPRATYMVANKLPPWDVNNPKDADKILNESLRRCGLDYFDFYLMHSLTDGREQHIEDAGMFEWAQEQKKKGIIKHVGFSFHGSTPYLERLLNRHPKSEFVQLQLNYMDVLRGQAGDWQALALKHKKPIIVMEPVKGGTLASLPAPAEALLKAHDPSRSIASWAIQYAATLEGVTSTLSGMTNLEQVKDNLKTFKNLKPLTKEELSLLEKVITEIGKISNIPCTGCKYCHKYCPKGIDIATNFSIYNEHKRGNQLWNSKMMYDVLPKEAKAERCTSCGKCLEYCPQHVDIPTGLSEVAKSLT